LWLCLEHGKISQSPNNEWLQPARSGPVFSCLCFFKLQQMGHTAGNFLGVMGHIDNIRLALAPDNLNGIQNPLSIGGIKPLAWLIQN
jgi:hypothetical protein